MPFSDTAQLARVYGLLAESHFRRVPITRAEEILETIEEYCNWAIEVQRELGNLKVPPHEDFDSDFAAQRISWIVALLETCVGPDAARDIKLRTVDHRVSVPTPLRT